jgi:hypothetical protein
MNTNTIEVPRDNPKNNGVCADVENFILDIFTKDPNECHHIKEITLRVVKKFADKYAGIGHNHVMHAVDQFFANSLIKRVAPSTFEAIEGPDDEYSERMTGHVPEGEPYAKRPKNYTANPLSPANKQRANFNRELSKAQTSVKILRGCKDMTDEKILAALIETKNFNPVAVKIALKTV